MSKSFPIRESIIFSRRLRSKFITLLYVGKFKKDLKLDKFADLVLLLGRLRFSKLNSFALINLSSANYTEQLRQERTLN